MKGYVIERDGEAVGLIWSTAAAFAAQRFGRLYPEAGEVTAVEANGYDRGAFVALVSRLEQARQ